jgi:hypothetical protein
VEVTVSVPKLGPFKWAFKHKMMILLKMISIKYHACVDTTSQNKTAEVVS